MKVRFTLRLVFILAASSFGAYAQCPAPDFVLPATACRGQNLTLTNLSSAGSFEWDYCIGDLSNTPTTSTAYTLPGVSGRPSFEYVKDGDHWYAFVTGTFHNKFYRVDLGTDPTQAPALIEDLGDLGGKLHSPGAIRLIKSNGNWFGLLHNTDNGELLKLSFGTSPGNAFTVSSLFTGIGSTNNGMAVAHDDTDGWICIVTNANAFQIIRLGEDIVSPAPADILVTPAVPNPNTLFDVDLVRMCDQWFAFASNLGNGNIYRVTFGTSLFHQPVVDQVADVGGGLNGGRLRVARDGEQYYIFEVSLGGSFFKVGLGDDLANLSVTVDTDLTFSLTNTVGVGVVLFNSTWNISVVDASTFTVNSVKYPNNCSAVEFDGDDTSPGIRYAQQGTYDVSLTMTNATGISSSITKSITVSSVQAPDISIAAQNVCVGSNVNFTPTSVAGGISTYDWNFGDGTAHSGSIAPTHIYSSAGSFKPSLVIQGSNGCSNNIHADIKLYDKPTANFTIPSGLVCTNNEYTFVNNTAGNYDGILQYSWSVDGTGVSTTRDLEYTFAATGNEDVMLTVSIPGCSDNLTKPVNGIDSGPTVGFTFGGRCENESISFTNSSAGSITGYSWAFDDGSTSTDTDPDHTFVDAGVFSVALSTTGTNGCVSTTSHDVSVYTSPQPSFSLDLPPFSCAGTPSQFHDITSALPDSNIQTWNWTFGDTGAGTGKNPIHTYSQAGPYTVRLAVITDKGCSGFSDQQVTIAGSPVAAFNFDPACLNQSTHFSDASTGGVVAWQWKVGSAVYTSQNATHAFAVPGSFSIQLTVTGQNSCTSTLSKPVVVPIVPLVDFDVRNQCSGQLAVFTDLTVNAADPVSQRTWTFGANGTGTGQVKEFAFTNAGTYPVQLQVQSQSGCVYSTSKQVVIRQSPVASFTMSDQSGPPPLHVSFANTSTGASSYQWNFNDGNQPITEVSPERIYTTLGNYVVNLTAISVDNCRTTDSKVVSVIVPVNELALEEFSLVMPSGGDAYLAYVRVHNNGNYRIEGFGVSYTVGGGILLRETVIASLEAGETKTLLLSNQFVDAGTAAYVCAELDNDNNLSDNKECTTLTNAPVIFDASPNPADTFVNVETVNAAPGTVRVRVYGMDGGVGYDRMFDVDAGLSRISLDVQNLSPGLYVVIVSSASVASSQKILIAR